MKILRIRIRERAEAEIKVVNVEAIEGKTEVFVGRFEQRRVFKSVAQAKSAVVEEIVAEPGVTHAGLFGGSLERGMGVDHAHGYEKAVIRNAVETDASIIVGDVFHEPIDRVVGVRAFVHALRVARLVQGAKHDELAFRAITAANILKSEDVALGNHIGIPVDQVADALVSAGDAVRSPIHENRQRRSCFFRGVDLGVQLRAVAHGNHHFHLVEER